MVVKFSVQYSGGLLPDIIHLYGHTYSKSMDQPGKRLPILLVVSCTGKMFFFCQRSFVPENLVSRDGFGSPVPRPYVTTLGNPFNTMKSVCSYSHY